MTHYTPAIPLFGDAYLADTRHLSLEEHGAYLQLIMIAWRTEHCALPDDDARLARMLGVTAKKWSKLKPVVMAFWELGEHGWQQKRLTKEFRFVAKSREQKAEAANAMWKAKRLKTKGADDAAASSPHMQNECGNDAPTPTPTEEKNKEEEETADAAPLEFDGRVIRLTLIDYRRWEKAHPLLNLRAVLQSRDDWLATAADEATRKKWFISTSNHLANLSQQAKADAAEPLGTTLASRMNAPC